MKDQIPDPDEKWSDFFKRVLKFEIYQPPLVDKSTVPFEKRNTLYMKAQTKLIELEFNKEGKINNFS